MAPEVVSKQGYDKSVDWWAVGILMYEMLIGVTPFFNRNQNVLLHKIQKSKVVFPDRTRYKIDFSDNFQDLVNRLLHKDKTQRMGAGPQDFEEVLAHPFFKDINIENIYQ